MPKCGAELSVLIRVPGLLSLSVAFLAAVLPSGCGNSGSGPTGGAETRNGPDVTDDAETEAESSPSEATDAGSQPQLIVDAVTDVQLSSTGKAGALVLDPQQIPQILLAFALDPCSAGPELEALIDETYMSEFGHDVDFIVLVIDPSVHALVPVNLTEENVTFYYGFRYFDEGIGTDDEENSSVGPPSLRGYTILEQREYLVDGTVLHELGHAWAVHLQGPPVLAEVAYPPDVDASDCSSDRRVGHWNQAHVNGMMGGWSDLAGICDDSEPVPYVRYRMGFAPVELYLMGLAGPDEVPPLHIYPDNVVVEWVFQEDPDDPHGGYDELVCVDVAGHVFSRDEFEAQTTVVTIDEIIEYNGERVPSTQDSPKHFRIALLILAAELLDDDDWDFYERALDFLSAPEERSVRDSFPAEHYPQFHDELVAAEEYWAELFGEYPFLSFYMATGGRATIEFVELAVE